MSRDDRAGSLRPSAGSSRYHRQLAQEKREAVLAAATRLFLAHGYRGTSLAGVAAEAAVSRATLFKQFPTKAELFDAMVAAAWAPDAHAPRPPAGDLGAGLRTFGTRYAELLGGPGMLDLFRIVIAETPHLPELSRSHFALGKMPFFSAVRDYLHLEQQAGTAAFGDLDLATTHFLGMIANFVFWPRLLLPTWQPAPAAVARCVEEAVTTMCVRYGTTEPDPHPRT